MHSITRIINNKWVVIASCLNEIDANECLLQLKKQDKDITFIICKGV